MTAVAQASSVPQRRTRTFFFEIALTSACGLLFTAAIDTAARYDLPWAADYFWIGLLLIFVPPLLGMLLLDLSRNERVALVVLAGLALYFVKVLHSPAYFTMHDELLHVKTADTILQSGRLFTENPLLPVSPLFPGLHLATVSLAQLLQIDIFGAGVILLALMRVMFMIAVFVLLEYTTRSTRVAGLGTLIYMGNSNFVFFSAQYAYESVALPVAMLLICLIVRRGEYTGMRRLLLNLVAVMLVLVVVATHHVTSYMTILFMLASLLVLLVQPIIDRITRWLDRRITRTALYRRLLIHFIPSAEASPGQVQPLKQQVLAWSGVLMIVMSIAWLMYVATPTLNYLRPIFSGAIAELISIIQREGQARELFTSASGNVRPLWERLVTIGSVLIVLLMLPYGALEVWRKYRQQMIALLLTVAAAAYFASIGLRFTERGWEIANRASEFLFLGVALITALGALSLFRHSQDRVWRNLLIAAGACIIFIGGFMAGLPSWARVPGPYMVGADTRSIEAEGMAAARWTGEQFAPDTRLVVDRINGLLMGAFGRQYIIRSGKDNIQIAPVLTTLRLSDYEYYLLRATQAEYVVTDRRLTQAIPELGVFVEFGEPGASQHTEPLNPFALEKFDLLTGVSRVFDSGNIVIYDVRGLDDATTQP